MDSILSGNVNTQWNTRTGFKSQLNRIYWHKDWIYWKYLKASNRPVFFVLCLFLSLWVQSYNVAQSKTLLLMYFNKRSMRPKGNASNWLNICVSFTIYSLTYKWYLNFVPFSTVFSCMRTGIFPTCLGFNPGTTSTTAQWFQEGNGQISCMPIGNPTLQKLLK